MGRKSLDLAEAVIGSLIEQIGPKKFIVATLNATSHGGAFHDCVKVDLDFDDEDLKLRAWHEGLDRLQEVGKWLETDSDTVNVPSFIQNRDNSEEGGLHPYDRRSISELRLDDQTIQPISVIENLVFEMCGRKIRILRKDSAKTTVLLRGALIWFVDALRVELATEGDIYDVFKFIARCIGEDKVKVTHENWEFTCRVDGHVKHRRVDQEDDSDRFETNIDDLGELIEHRLGAHFEIVVEGIADTAVLGCTRAQFIKTLDGYVERVRSVGYVVDSLFDLYGLIVRPPCVRQRYVAGPDKAPISQREARRRLEALR